MKHILFAIFCFSVVVTNAQETFPDISIKTIDEKPISTEAFNNDDTSYIYSFWATWCVPCINELDAINDVYEDWQDEVNLEVIAVSTDDARTKKRVRPLVNGKDWPFKILLDDNQDLKRALNINVLPYVIIVKNGKIIHKRTGYTPGSEDELFEIIKEHSN